jgi:hypothetical protein
MGAKVAKSTAANSEGRFLYAVASRGSNKEPPVPALLIHGKACGRGYIFIPSGVSKNHKKTAAFQNQAAVSGKKGFISRPPPCGG